MAILIKFEVKFEEIKLLAQKKEAIHLGKPLFI
jgi:hypothetical protein